MEKSLELYLAYPFDSRFEIRGWELEFEKRTGIKLINLFYDENGPNVIALDAERRERYNAKEDDTNKLVSKNIKIISIRNGIIAMIDGSLSYWTIQEIVC